MTWSVLSAGLMARNMILYVVAPCGLVGRYHRYDIEEEYTVSNFSPEDSALEVILQLVSK
jgi:hypothetical protein